MFDILYGASFSGPFCRHNFEEVLFNRCYHFYGACFSCAFWTCTNNKFCSWGHHRIHLHASGLSPHDCWFKYYCDQYIGGGFICMKFCNFSGLSYWVVLMYSKMLLSLYSFFSSVSKPQVEEASYTHLEPLGRKLE